MKYTKEFKLECVLKYRNGECIHDPPGVRHKAFHNQVIRWNKMYDSMGEAGLEHGRPTLDIEQRVELIRRIENGESCNAVACNAGINSDLLAKWHRIYSEKGMDGLKSLKRGRPSTSRKKVETDINKADEDKTREELLEELKLARIENEYLKKLSALVQERKAREQKKKQL